MLIVVFGGLGEIEFINSENPHSVELLLERWKEVRSNTDGSLGIRTIIKAQQLTVNIHTS